MAVALDYEVGSAVFVAYPFPNSLAFLPQARVVTSIDVVGVDDLVEVRFNDGEKLQDSNTLQTIYLVEADAAAAIVTDVIAKSAGAVVLDATTSVASTVSQPSTTLGRVS